MQHCRRLQRAGVGREWHRGLRLSVHVRRCLRRSAELRQLRRWLRCRRLNVHAHYCCPHDCHAPNAGARPHHIVATPGVNAAGVVRFIDDDGSNGSPRNGQCSPHCDKPARRRAHYRITTSHTTDVPNASDTAANGRSTNHSGLTTAHFFCAAVIVSYCGSDGSPTGNAGSPTVNSSPNAGPTDVVRHSPCWIPPAVHSCRHAAARFVADDSPAAAGTGHHG